MCVFSRTFLALHLFWGLATKCCYFTLDSSGMPGVGDGCFLHFCTCAFCLSCVSPTTSSPACGVLSTLLALFIVVSAPNVSFVLSVAGEDLLVRPVSLDCTSCVPDVCYM